MPAEIRDALQNEILPLLRGGNTRVLPDPALEDKEDAAFFEIHSQYEPAHAFPEWMWLLSGEAHLRLNGRIYTMQPGDSCFLPPMLNHSDVFSRETPAYRSLWLSFHGNEVNFNLFEYRPFGTWSIPVTHSVPSSAALRFLRANLQDELTRRDEFSREIVHGLLIQMVGYLLRSLNSAESEGRAKSGRVSSRVHEFLNEHYREPLTLEDVARAMYLSPSYLSRLYRRETGRTIFEALAELRVERAARLLVEDNMPLHEIAAAVGYRDTDHFARVFRRLKGLPPSQYK